jgi:hypothetical protein
VLSVADGRSFFEASNAILVGARQPAVSDHVGNQNPREFPGLGAISLPSLLEPERAIAAPRDG